MLTKFTSGFGTQIRRLKKTIDWLLRSVAALRLINVTKMINKILEKWLCLVLMVKANP